ncbi:hypothetical protein MIN45_P0955 [Methylomarinovum tepidoasis]|uniref:DUF2330 domain-containing protein n=1 Tax=Methylomarinovum tepidoasis TaxID=2840183 RepID=A0AAU9C9M8_9GAMM|nr:DUF2330 domain-containing protein [Methylomarinovum sp. IN45]BCX88586.1 hypothetical protein MIN45_P0955 [Methylomarinovum sp. IN45]
MRILLLFLLSLPTLAQAFCGFYVARAGTDLFNRSSKVVLVRDGERTVLTMANDFQGDVKDFAVVVPVPTFIGREQIHVGSTAVIDHLDAYTAPRLVEYFDPNPCQRLYRLEMKAMSAAADRGAAARAKALGVTIEARYTVGEYDILILSAKESAGLITWLKENGYRLPQGAEPVVGSYIKQGMRFFVARVNLAEFEKTGFNYLRPLQVAYESPKFMLPIRLGTLNARGRQELFLWTLTRSGRVETANYPTVKIPSGQEIPLYVKDRFADFYRDLFARQVEKHGGRAVFTEYAWDMGWCDPCAAQPLSRSELRELGVMWLAEEQPVRPLPRAKPQVMPRPVDVFVTRLHLQYDAQTFPDDLRLHQTGDRGNFQARYVLRHPWDGSDDCPEARRYRGEILPQRLRRQAENLHALTGWPLAEIYREMGLKNPPEPQPWWKRLWPN